MKLNKLPRSFYARDTQLVARELLGKYLVHEKEGIKRIGKLVEVEAYLGEKDLAAHSSKGITPRTKVMFGPPGYAYVYLIYGMYFCMNVVTGEEGQGAAVLFRAIEPIANIDSRTQGPGLLCKAMHINKQVYGQDFVSEHLFIAERADVNEVISIVKSPRIGVDYAKHWARRHLRYYIKNNEFVSRR